MKGDRVGKEGYAVRKGQSAVGDDAGKECRDTLQRNVVHFVFGQVQLSLGLNILIVLPCAGSEQLVKMALQGTRWDVRIVHLQADSNFSSSCHTGLRCSAAGTVCRESGLYSKTHPPFALIQGVYSFLFLFGAVFIHKLELYVVYSLMLLPTATTPASTTTTTKGHPVTCSQQAPLLHRHTVRLQSQPSGYKHAEWPKMSRSEHCFWPMDV